MYTDWVGSAQCEDICSGMMRRSLVSESNKTVMKLWVSAEQEEKDRRKAEDSAKLSAEWVKGQCPLRTYGNPSQQIPLAHARMQTRCPLLMHTTSKNLINFICLGDQGQPARAFGKYEYFNVLPMYVSVCFCMGLKFWVKNIKGVMPNLIQNCH